jgi:hypothetical protein
VELLKDKSRKSQCKNWKIGDKLIMTEGNEYSRDLKTNKSEYAILKGWSLNHLYINCGDDLVHKVDWKYLESNKSDCWRKNFEEAKKVMGCNPEFPNGVGESNGSTDKIDGKPIELLSEIECQVHLAAAIEKEDYSLAEKLRKRMEKFR